MSMYILEGNIGAGKSTFLTLLAQQDATLSVGLEPLHEWQNQIYGQSLLAHFYENPQRWAYTFENLTLISRVQNHLLEQKIAHPFHIVERSIYSGNYVFARNSYENSFLTTLEWHMYQHWFNFLTDNKCKQPKGFIYLRISPEIAFERIKKRNRRAEKKLTLAYLRQIHEKHESFLIKKQAIHQSLYDIPLLIIDANDNFEENPLLFAQHTQNIHNFFAKTSLEKERSLCLL